MDKLQFAEKISGVSLVRIGEGVPLVVLGTGSGIVMAYADCLADKVPGIGVWATDLSGSIGVERRCVAIDYFAQVLPTVFLLWSGLCSAMEYPKMMKERGFSPAHKFWTYVRGIDDEAAKLAFRHELGAIVINNLWRELPTLEEVSEVKI